MSRTKILIIVLAVVAISKSDVTDHSKPTTRDTEISKYTKMTRKEV
jgi:hypothetical protein